jgi:DNA-binding transcriptional regulator YiaG
MANAANRSLRAKARDTVEGQVSYQELILGIRTRLGLSQEDLARKIGVSYASVNRWENGQVTPSKLAKAQIKLLAARVDRKAKVNISLHPGSRAK